MLINPLDALCMATNIYIQGFQAAYYVWFTEVQLPTFVINQGPICMANELLHL